MFCDPLRRCLAFGGSGGDERSSLGVNRERYLNYAIAPTHIVLNGWLPAHSPGTIKIVTTSTHRVFNRRLRAHLSDHGSNVLSLCGAASARCESMQRATAATPNTAVCIGYITLHSRVPGLRLCQGLSALVPGNVHDRLVTWLRSRHISHLCRPRHRNGDAGDTVRHDRRSLRMKEPLKLGDWVRMGAMIYPHREYCRRDHRIIGQYLAEQAWLRRLDCIVLVREEIGRAHV